MELVETYNKINELLNETEEQRNAFYRAADAVKETGTFSSIIKTILKCFSNPYYRYNLRNHHFDFIGKYKFINFGIESVCFYAGEHRSQYYTLKSISKETLTTSLNSYAPVPLEVQEIFINEFKATVIVTLKDLKI